jgi:putative DNA primase/helicase
MIEGCLEWQRRRLDAPEAVVAATGRYLEQEDTFKAWLADCCVVAANEITPVAWLFYSWRRWAESSGEYIGSQKRFSQRLESEGFAADRVRVGGKLARVFRGVGLSKTDENRPEPEAESGAGNDVPPF